MCTPLESKSKPKKPVNTIFQMYVYFSIIAVVLFYGISKIVAVWKSDLILNGAETNCYAKVLAKWPGPLNLPQLEGKGRRYYVLTKSACEDNSSAKIESISQKLLTSLRTNKILYTGFFPYEGYQREPSGVKYQVEKTFTKVVARQEGPTRQGYIDALLQTLLVVFLAATVLFLSMKTMNAIGTKVN